MSTINTSNIITAIYVCGSIYCFKHIEILMIALATLMSKNRNVKLVCYFSRKLKFVKMVILGCVQ